MRVRGRANKSGKKKVAFDIGGRANGMGHRGPERLGNRGGPEQPAARLEFNSCKVRVQNLGAGLERQPVGNDGNIVLYKRRKKVVGSPAGIEKQAGGICQFAPRAEPDAEAPGNLIARPEVRPPQEIHVESVSHVAEVRFVAIGAVIVDLELKVVSLVERPGPAPQNISAGEALRAGDDL